MKPILISLFDQHPLMASIAAQMDVEIGKITLRDFPDGETYIQFENSLQDKEVIILSSLEKPNPKILPLLFISETARELGAKRIGLCAPYLAYMRQDKRFNIGEGITSNYFAKLLSAYFDWLVTVDPHLHRRHNLNEIYSIPSAVIHAASQISQWIKNEITNPVLIGPDSESEQWVSKVAERAQAPYLILQKTRHGDREVDITPPAIESYFNHTPVLVDDIISTAQTMIETIKHLKQLKMRPPVCIGIHAIFAGNAYESLLQADADQIVTCNTISHPSNHVDLSTIIISGIKQQIGGT